MLRQPTARRRQLGAIQIIYLFTLPMIIGVMGFMIDLSRVQARRAELQVAVDAAALAAAKSLLTSPTNYTAATTAAGQAINSYGFAYNANLIALPAATVTFGATKDSTDWSSAADAAGSGFGYARVDSLAAPDSLYGQVDTLLIHALSMYGGSPVVPIHLNVGAVAIAGPLGITVGLHQ